MKLRNKKTGEIGELQITEKHCAVVVGNGTADCNVKLYCTLDKLNEEWEDVPEEEWRDVLEFEELYQVSNFGNVRTVKNGEAEMSQQENRNGYMTVHLRNKGVERRAMVHRLVAEAFIPNPDELRDVNHKNGDKSDNRVENLEWVNHSDNMTHSFRELGKNVRHIVQLDLDNNFIERWNSITEASEATGICRTDIGECCRGNRKHTKGYKWKYEEDYEEPRTFFTIYYDGTISEFEDGDDDQIRDMKAIGNYFETKEEAEKAVEKLKAWKRLKDKGAKIIDYACYGGTDTKGEFLGEIKVTIDAPHEIDKYLFDLLFGGEE